MPFLLKVEKREGRGKSEARKLRREGYIPAVAYGRGEKTTPLKVPIQNFKDLMKETHGEKTVIYLQMGRSKKWAVLKEVMRHPVTGKILHADFLLLHKGETLTIKVPVILEGVPKGTKLGGVLEQITREIEIRSIPTKLPPHISVDVTGLGLGDSIFVRDIKLEDVEILEDPDTPIATVLVPRRVEVREEVEVEAEVEEAEAEAPPEEKEKEKEEEQKE